MHILLIRLRMIGDVVFTTPAIRALRCRFPEARIDYLVEESAAEVVQDNPHLDEVIVIPLTFGVRRIRDDLRIGSRLRRRRFDLVIDFHGGPRGSWLSWLTRAPRRIGYSVAGRRWMYTDVIARPRELRPRHSVQNQWDLLAPLGVDSPDPSRDGLEMPESADARREVSTRLAAAGVPADAPLVVVHVSAGNPFRRWPAERFGEVVAALVREDARRWVVVTSGPSDRRAVEQVGDAARARLPGELAGHVARCGEFGLRELRSLVARAALYIGCDSGPLHIAGTTTTPVVGLYGPTLPVRSAPWRDPAIPAAAVEPAGLACRPCDQRVCVHGDFRCLQSIAAATVLDAARRVLREGSATPSRIDRAPVGR
jgi:predicted lipopolysaccharide heptosyltransferase III